MTAINGQPYGRQLLVVITPVPVLFPQLVDALVQPAAGLLFDLKTHMFGREDTHDPCKPVTGLVGTEHRDIEGRHADEQHHEEFLRRLAPRRITSRRTSTRGRSSSRE